MQAFTAAPTGPAHTQLTFFPDDSRNLIAAAKRSGMTLDGPHPVFLVQGDDELGALVDIHQRLFHANVSVYASNGVADGKGGYGYVIYVRPRDFQRAAQALELAEPA
jgi:hypothetical protein